MANVQPSADDCLVIEKCKNLQTYTGTHVQTLNSPISLCWKPVPGYCTDSQTNRCSNSLFNMGPYLLPVQSSISFQSSLDYTYHLIRWECYVNGVVLHCLRMVTGTSSCSCRVRTHFRNAFNLWQVESAHVETSNTEANCIMLMHIRTAYNVCIYIYTMQQIVYIFIHTQYNVYKYKCMQCNMYTYTCIM